MVKRIKRKYNKKAFTLVELLVVIAIIGILATLAIISLQQARINARDAKRTADIRQIQIALELYFNENGRYPSSAEFEIGEPLISFSTGKILMQQIPSAPNILDGDCSFTQYEYISSEDDSDYELSFCLGKELSDIPAGSLIAFAGGIKRADDIFVCGDILIDSRDENTYETVLIGGQCWMAENLRYLPEVYPPNNSSVVDSRYYVYNYQGFDIEEAKSSSNYLIFGALYNWPAAMGGEFTEGVQGACPENWHLPTNDEFKILEGFVDFTYEIGDLEWNKTGFRGSDVASKLAGKFSLWNNGYLIQNINFSDSGLNIVPSGIRHSNSSFSFMSTYAHLWTSSMFGSDKAYRRLFLYNTTMVDSNYRDLFFGFAVRCLKN